MASIVYYRLNPDDFSTVLQLADGWYPLEQTPDSGALDYIRSPAFQGHEWVAGDWRETAAALETVIDGGNKFYVYGEPFGRHGHSTRRSAHRGSARVFTISSKPGQSYRRWT